MKISLCLIATNRYKELVPALLDSVNEFFLPGHDITVHLFCDELSAKLYNIPIDRITVKEHLIPSYGFPEATLYRYKIMTSLPISDYGDYTFYLDVDMQIVKTVGDEILHDLVAVSHPGYYNGGGSWEINPNSNCFVPDFFRRKYVAGGFQGGTTICYYNSMVTMAKWIEEDQKNNIIPVWHDESAWNKFITSQSGIRQMLHILTPDYCMPEPINKRIAWDINNFEPKILALEKPENFRA